MGIDQVLVWCRHCSCNNKQQLTWIFVYPNNALDCLLMSASSCQAFSFVICISWPRNSCMLLKAIGTNMFNLQPSQHFTATSDIRDYQHYLGTCCLQLWLVLILPSFMTSYHHGWSVLLLFQATQTSPIQAPHPKTPRWKEEAAHLHHTEAL